MKLWTLALAGSALLALTACSVGEEGASLEGRLWALESYQNSDGETVDVIKESEARAKFDNGQISGTSGCNNFFGPYEVNGNEISIGPLGATLMACPEPLMKQEFGFTSALHSAHTYEIAGDTLELSDVDGEVIVTMVETEPISLAGSSWVAISVNNGRGGVQSVVIGNEITALFGEDGSLSGSAGCNNYSGTYEVIGENMTIGPLAVTEMFCEEPEGTMEQEAEYLAALGTAATWSIDGGHLRLRTELGSLAVDYRAEESSE